MKEECVKCRGQSAGECCSHSSQLWSDSPLLLQVAMYELAVHLDCLFELLGFVFSESKMPFEGIGGQVPGGAHGEHAGKFTVCCPADAIRDDHRIRIIVRVREIIGQIGVQNLTGSA